MNFTTYLDRFSATEIEILQEALKNERNCSTFSKTTSKWYKDPSDTKKDLCQKCYQEQKRILKRNEKSLEPNPKRARFS